MSSESSASYDKVPGSEVGAGVSVGSAPSSSSNSAVESPYQRNGSRNDESYHRTFSLEDTSVCQEENSGNFIAALNYCKRLKNVLLVGFAAVVMLVGLVAILSSRKRPNANVTGGGSTDDVIVENSCGIFFEPDDIMALEDSSTVKNVRNGAVAADMSICSDLGVSILRDQNGNAVDAAVATALCLGVVNPASSGIGGGAMILVHSDIASHKSKIGHRDYVPPQFHDERRSPHSPDDGDTKRKVTEIVDCREEAPAASTYDMFSNLAKEASTDGGLAIGIPGELRGLELTHSRHGKLTWSKVVEPAMKLARDGFPVSRELAHEIQINRKKVLNFPELVKILTKNNDGKTFLKEGDTFTNPHLAETLRSVMKNGADAIYTGNLGSQISEDIRAAGGIITAEDLANYRPALRDPLVAQDVSGFTLVGMPPPSSGGAAVIGAARLLSGYSNPLASFADTLSKHRFIEASKHVFAIRMSLSDPAFNTNVTMEAVADLVRGEYMEELRQMTNDSEVLPLSQYGGSKWAQLHDDEGQGEVADANEGDRRRRMANARPDQRRQMREFGYLEDHGTTHLSVVDKDRNAVSITSTVNTYFGSKVVSPSTGIIFNNQMDDFATPGRPNHFGLHPSKANYIMPHKKPLSSMSPTMVFRPLDDEDDDEKALGDVFMVLGASGGPKIISAVTQTFINHALLGMPLYESVAHSRLHDQLLYHGKVAATYEQCPLLQGPTIKVLPRTTSALKNRHQRLLSVNYMGTVQAVAVDLETDTLTAVSDVRKDGAPAGY